MESVDIDISRGMQAWGEGKVPSWESEANFVDFDEGCGLADHPARICDRCPRMGFLLVRKDHIQNLGACRGGRCHANFVATQPASVLPPMT